MAKQDRSMTGGSRVLTREETDALRKEAEAFKAAQRQVTEAVSVLWNAQLDLAISVGDADLVERLIGRPVGLWDDCDCNKKSCTPAMLDPSWWAQVNRPPTQ